MPNTEHTPAARQRFSGLLLAAVLGLAGCQTPGPAPTPAPTPAPKLHPLSVRTVKTFSPAPPPYQCQQAAAAPAPGNPLVACDTAGTDSYTLGPEAVVLHPTHAESRQNATGYGVVVTLDQPSQAAFASYTSANVGTQAALVLNGTVIGAPEIQVPVNSNQLEISTYGETAQQADAIVKSLES